MAENKKKEKNNSDFRTCVYWESEYEDKEATPIIRFTLKSIETEFEIYAGCWRTDKTNRNAVAFARRLAQLIDEGFFENFTEAELDVTNLGSDLS